jgi:hypothetical protein
MEIFEKMVNIAENTGIYKTDLERVRINASKYYNASSALQKVFPIKT